MVLGTKSLTLTMLRTPSLKVAFLLTPSIQMMKATNQLSPKPRNLAERIGSRSKSLGPLKGALPASKKQARSYFFRWSRIFAMSR